MKAAVSVVFLVLGVVGGLYVGGWIMLVGGAVLAIQLLQGTVAVTAPTVAECLARIIFSPLVGWGIFYGCTIVSIIVVGAKR